MRPASVGGSVGTGTLVGVEGPAGAKEPADIEEPLHAEEIVIISYKHQYEYKQRIIPWLNMHLQYQKIGAPPQVLRSELTKR